MKKNKLFILALFFFLSFPALASAASLDELYRDIIKSDNQGYLPMFVKNRNQPDILLDEKSIENVPDSTIKPDETPDITINLLNERKLREEAEKAALRKWDETIKAIETNQVTAFELEEVNRRVKLNDPLAIEILAWMNVKGVGVQTNLVEAFKLYQKAVVLQIPNADANASAVYKAMNREQLELLKSSPNQYLED